VNQAQNYSGATIARGIYLPLAGGYSLSSPLTSGVMLNVGASLGQTTSLTVDTGATANITAGGDLPAAYATIVDTLGRLSLQGGPASPEASPARRG